MTQPNKPLTTRPTASVLESVYLSISPSSDGLLHVACSYQPAIGLRASAPQALALDLVNAAHKAGAAVVPGNACTGRPNALLLVALARALLNPEELGFAATPELRDMARLALGHPACETSLRGVAAGSVGMQMHRVLGTTAQAMAAGTA